MSRAESPALAAAVRLPASPDGEAAVITYHSPRTTVLDVAPSCSPDAAARLLAGDCVKDPTVAVHATDAPLRDFAETLRAALPEARVLSFEPAPIQKFLWFYRDAHDPMALGHASDRILLDESWLRRDPPNYRAGKRREQRKAIEATAALLLLMGNALGFRPPFPRNPEDVAAWGIGRFVDLIDTSLGLIAALLCRWGSPLALVRDTEGPAPELLLADRWLRTHLGIE